VETRRPDSRAKQDEGKIERGWRLTQVAWKLVQRDRTLLALALAGVACATVFSGLIFYFGGYFSHPQHSNGRLALIALIALYPSVLFSVFFNVALASAASAAFDGDHMTVREALRLAYGKRGRIALWALISAFVGVVIAEIANRLPGGGRVVGWLAGAAWGLATIFVIPILAMESIGAVDSLKRSAKLVKGRWGEGVSGNVAIGAWAVVATIPLALLIGIGAATAGRHPGTGLPLLATGLVGLISISALVAATRQIFAVALYRYAIDAPVGGFSSADLEYPFTPDPARKKRRSWILRLGGGFLALFAVFCIAVAIFHPGRRAAEGYYGSANGYFQYSWAAGEAPNLEIGAPVEYHGRRIGEIVRLSAEGSELRVSIWVVPAYRPSVEAHPAYAVGPPSYQHLCIGKHRECRPAAPRDRGDGRA
jgi:hypothetical protein